MVGKLMVGKLMVGESMVSTLMNCKLMKGKLMNGKLKDKASLLTVLFLLAQTGATGLLCACAAQASEVKTEETRAEKKEEKKEEKAEDIAAAEKLYEQYQKLDKACDPALVDLYAPEAQIESEIERKDTPTLKEKYNREKFCSLITKTFADPVMSKISASTEYDAALLKKTRRGKDTVEVEFHACQGDTAMNVKWLVRKMPSGNWQIVKENSLTYRKSVGQAHPEK
jgi:hypothetical protein